MASDNFNTDNDPIAAPWDTWGTFAGYRTSGGVAIPTSGSAGMFYSSSSVAFSKATIADVTSFNFYVALHCSEAGGVADGYIAGYNGTSTSCAMYRIDDEGFTLLNSGSAPTIANGDTLSIRRSGGDVILARNDSDILTATDSTYTTGSPGVWSSSGDTRYGDWTDVGSSPDVTVGASGSAVTGGIGTQAPGTAVPL